MPTLPANLPGYVYVILFVLVLLIGGGGGGFWVAWRRDRRQAPLDEVATDKARLELGELVQRIAKNSVADAAAQMDAQDEQHRKQVEQLITEHRDETAALRAELMKRIIGERDILMARIRLLEELIRSSGQTVPTWPEGAALELDD